MDLHSIPTAAPSGETARLLEHLNQRNAQRSIAVPTNDDTVRKRLRQLGHPITLFGERREDRRDRLRSILAALAAAEAAERGDAMSEDGDSSEDDEDDEDQEEEFYTEGEDVLLEARRYIAEYSLPRARERLAMQRKQVSVPLGRILDYRKAIYKNLRTFSILGTQHADSRAISSVEFSPDSSLLLAGSWTGTSKIWSVPDCKCQHVLAGHADNMRVCGVAWHPQATLSLGPEVVNFATASQDATVCLWSLNGNKGNGEEKEEGVKKKKEQQEPSAITTPLRRLVGHVNRVCRTRFHPSGRFLGSASFDGTWRLWDVESGVSLLEQEGHSKEVYALAFQNDGSLICSGGLDAIGRVWDLRTGKAVMVLDGHVQDILGIDFSPNGYQVATGSNDDHIRIWDVRTLQSIYTIPAHNCTVSDVKFFRSADEKYPVMKTNKENNNNSSNSKDVKENGGADMEEDKDTMQDIEEKEKDIELPASGTFLASSSFDGTVKLWSSDDWQLIKGLYSESGGRITSVDMSGDGKFIASGESQNTFKLWASEDYAL